MPITARINGDLIKLAKAGRYRAIAHGCNIFNTMGSGIAPLIAKAWPAVREADNYTVRGDFDKLGQFTMVTESEQHQVLRIFNLYTQGSFSKGDNLDLNYKALSDAFTLMNKQILGIGRNAHYYDYRPVGIPMIGAGLGGGHWGAIETIIDLVTPDLDIELVVFDA
jgi:O-acetyl-ADP-ribose deacetylase (regulator of RNase III)